MCLWNIFGLYMDYCFICLNFSLFAETWKTGKAVTYAKASLFLLHLLNFSNRYVLERISSVENERHTHFSKTRWRWKQNTCLPVWLEKPKLSLSLRIPTSSRSHLLFFLLLCLYVSTRSGISRLKPTPSISGHTSKEWPSSQQHSYIVFLKKILDSHRTHPELPGQRK